MKIISKALANRLGPVHEEQIGEYHTGFIRNRNILNGVILAKEIIQQVRKENEGIY